MSNAGLDWQIIYGRRGTGKTTLLGALKEQIDANYVKKKSIAIKIDLFDCLVSTPIGSNITDEMRGYAYFEGFIYELCNRLFNEYLRTSPQSLLSRLINKSPKKNHIEDVLLDILSLSQDGIPVSAFSQKNDNERHYQQYLSMRKKASKASVAGKVEYLNVPSINADISTSLDAQSDATSDSSHERVIKSVSAPHFGLLRRKLLELLELLDLLDTKSLFILIDEWVILDRNLSSSLQPFFAEALKRTFHGSSRFSVKIASIRHQTQLSNKGNSEKYIGLEIGHDISDGTDLDIKYSQDFNLFEFYSELIFKRLKFCDKRLSRFDESVDGKPSGKPHKGFITSIFTSEDCFREIIRASGHIPRDFISIFNNVAIQYGFSTQRLWKRGVVLNKIVEHSIRTKKHGISTRELSGSNS